MNFAWAFATVTGSDPSLFGMLASTTVQGVGDFNTQDLANTAWAFTRVTCSAVPLLMLLAPHTERCVGEFTSQLLANTAWALARVGLPETQKIAYNP